jgi:alpha-mannosidase
VYWPAYEGYELNYPPLAVPTTGRTAILAPSQSFFGTVEDNVVITVVKKDADDNSLLIRYYGWAGKKGDVHITLPQPVMAAWETHLMEAAQVPTAVDSTGKVVAVPTNPYEIKTVKGQLRGVKSE